MTAMMTTTMMARTNIHSTLLSKQNYTVLKIHYVSHPLRFLSTFNVVGVVFVSVSSSFLLSSSPGTAVVAVTVFVRTGDGKRTPLANRLEDCGLRFRPR